MLREDLKSTEAVHGIQKGLQCCGINGAADWMANGREVPTSCCPEGLNACNTGTAFARGCGPLLHDVVSGSGKLIAWIAMIFAAFEVNH